jgi:hypothetical protein
MGEKSMCPSMTWVMVTSWNLMRCLQQGFLLGGLEEAEKSIDTTGNQAIFEIDQGWPRTLHPADRRSML